MLLAAANVIPPFENRPRLFVMFPVYYMATYFLQGFSNPPRATAAGRRSHRYACNPPVLHRPSKQQQLLRANQKSMLPHIVYSLHRSGSMDLCHTVTTRVLVVVSEKDAAKKKKTAVMSRRIDGRLSVRNGSSLERRRRRCRRLNGLSFKKKGTWRAAWSDIEVRSEAARSEIKSPSGKWGRLGQLWGAQQQPAKVVVVVVGPRLHPLHRSAAAAAVC